MSPVFILSSFRGGVDTFYPKGFPCNGRSVIGLCSCAILISVECPETCILIPAIIQIFILILVVSYCDTRDSALEMMHQNLPNPFFWGGQ